MTDNIKTWPERVFVSTEHDEMFVSELDDTCSVEYIRADLIHTIVAGALFDLMGRLTTQENRITLSSRDLAGPAVEALEEFANFRGLSLDDAAVSSWFGVLHTRGDLVKQEPVIPNTSTQKPVAWGVKNTRPTEEHPLMMVMLDKSGCQYPEFLIPLYVAPQEPVIPEGWKLVPIAHTEEMIELAWGDVKDMTKYELRRAYHALIAAAPEYKADK